MAKHEKNEASGMNGQSVFQLEEGKYGVAEAHVGAMDIVSADGSKIRFTKDNGMMVDKTFKSTNGGEVVKRVWRWEASRYLPYPATANTIEDLASNLIAFANDLVGFDAAEAFRLPNGREGKKGYKLLVNTKGEVITVVQYLHQLLTDAHTLASQRTMQTKMRIAAEAVLRAENNIAEPVKKVRTKKVGETLVEGEAINDSF